MRRRTLDVDGSHRRALRTRGPVVVAAALLILAGCSEDKGATGNVRAAGNTPPGQTTAQTTGQNAAQTGQPTGQPTAPATGAGKPKSDSAEGDSPTMLAAKQLFKTRCMQCHGANGKGDGAAAAALNPRPRNYTDKKWQASVKDEEIRDIIVKGGLEVGKSPLMPAQPDLLDKPEVVDALIELIRSFAEN